MILSNGIRSGFAGTDPDALIHRQNEDFTIADVAGPSAGDDTVDRRLDILIVDRDGNPYRAEQIDFADGTAVGGNVPFLLAASQSVADRHLEDVPLVQLLLDRIQSFRLDVGNDQFHVSPALSYDVWGTMPIEKQKACQPRIVNFKYLKIKQLQKMKN